LVDRINFLSIAGGILLVNGPWRSRADSQLVAFRFFG